MRDISPETAPAFFADCAHSRDVASDFRRGDWRSEIKEFISSSRRARKRLVGGLTMSAVPFDRDSSASLAEIPNEGITR